MEQLIEQRPPRAARTFEPGKIVMDARTDLIARPANPSVVLTRVFRARPELVFKAWTNSTLLAQWWGPHGFTNRICELDARRGGRIRIDMAAPGGTVYLVRGAFHEITFPEQIVFTATALEDDAGDSQLEALNTATFVEHEGKTQLVLQARVLKASPAAAAALAGMEEGWSQSLDRLGDLVTKLNEGI